MMRTMTITSLWGREFLGILENNQDKVRPRKYVYISTGCFISCDMVSNLHKIIIFQSFKAEILDLEISKLYILISCFS